MTDIALVWDAGANQADLALMSDGDLLTDDGLQTAVVISLATDRRAADDDVLTDGSNNRRGWWGDCPADGGAPDPIGSRLWLLRRAPASAQAQARAEDYAREALAWLIADGVAASVTVSSALRGDQLRLAIQITRRTVGVMPSRVFDIVWSTTLGAA